MTYDDDLSLNLMQGVDNSDHNPEAVSNRFSESRPTMIMFNVMCTNIRYKNCTQRFMIISCIEMERTVLRL